MAPGNPADLGIQTCLRLHKEINDNCCGTTQTALVSQAKAKQQSSRLLPGLRTECVPACVEPALVPESVQLWKARLLCIYLGGKSEKADFFFKNEILLEILVIVGEI